MISQLAPSLRFQAHLAFTQGLPSIQKCQKSLQTRPAPTHGQKDIAAKIKDRLTNDNNGQLVTGGCCQWRDSASYDSAVYFETVVLRRKYSVEPPNSTPPIR